MSRVSIVDPARTAEVYANNQLISDSLNDVGRLGLLGLGAGVGSSLLQEMLVANRVQKQRKPLNAVTLPVKTAVEGGPQTGLQPIGNVLAGGLYRDPNNPAPDNRLAGHKATVAGEIPWYYPAAGAVGLGGLFLGRSLTNNLLQARRKRDLADEVNEAKADFESALAGDPELLAKTASLQALSHKYEETVTGATKTATDWVGPLMGMYGAGLLAAGGAGAYLGWQQAAKSDPTRIRNEIARRRAAMRLAGQPIEVEGEPIETVKTAADDAGTGRYAYPPDATILSSATANPASSVLPIRTNNVADPTRRTVNAPPGSQLPLVGHVGQEQIYYGENKPGGLGSESAGQLKPEASVAPTMMSRAAGLYGDASNWMQSHPWQTAAIAGGTGLLAGGLYGARKKRRELGLDE